MTTFKITEFSVTGLHGDMDVSVNIKDNKLVLVGINGLGKSTFLNIFYLTISRQWHKLVEQPFKTLSIVVGGRNLSLNRAEIAGYQTLRRDVVRGLPRFRHLRDPVHHLEVPELLSLMDRPDSEQVRYFRDLGIPSSEIEYFRHITRIDKKQAKQYQNFVSVVKFLEESVVDQIVFLPTYRRIEKDLNVVIPGLEQEIKRLADHRRKAQQTAGGAFVELVEFGMEDVEAIFKSTLYKLKESARAELNALAGSYLRDVIRGEGRHFDRKFIEDLTDDELDDTLNRVEENTLNEDDKIHLREVLQKVRDGSKTTHDDESVAHFLTKLLNVGTTLRSNERSITRLARVCNEYLVGKALSYDEANYELRVNRANGAPIELKDLSSGEKQIVSLFSHIHLGGPGNFIVIIDEPELSLSVSWQRKLLPDLANSGRCSFIAAVTHSPFVFDNEFDAHTVDMTRLVSFQK